MELHAEEMQRMDKDTLRRIMAEKQDEISRQIEVLKEKDRELEELKKLLHGKSEEMIQISATRSGFHGESLEAVHEILASLERYTTEEVLFYAAQLLSEVLGTQDVAVYTVANRDYARLFSATSLKARELGNSIKYTDMEEMYQVLRNRRVYQNKEAKPGLPLMAGAIYGEEQMQVILMLWGIPYQRLDLVKKRLVVMETLLQNAVLRASRYMASFRRRHYLEGTNVLNEEAFTALVKVFLEAKTDGLTECTLVEIMMGYQDYETVALDISCNIRQTDYLGMMRGGKLHILLSNTNITNAKVVQERLQDLGYDSILKEV